MICTRNCYYADNTIQVTIVRALRYSFSVKISVTTSCHQIYCTEQQILQYRYCVFYTAIAVFFFLKYPATLLLQSAAQKFTNMFFL